MTIYQFLASDEEQQVQAFWDGVFVGERTVDGYKVKKRIWSNCFRR